MPDLIESIGLEIETDTLSPERVNHLVSAHFSPTHDASCESDAERLENGLLIKRGAGSILAKRGNHLVIGTEFVSQIIDSTRDDDLFEPISILCNFLIEEGEPLQSLRSGIHVHVCFTNPNLAMLRHSIILWRSLEDVFYLVGGMGYQFRGMQNDSTYCRPLTKCGPIAVPVRSGSYVKSIDLDDLINSPTTRDFWERWGDLPNQQSLQNRYFPVRYHGFNLSPAYNGGRNYKGTAEFRVFNKTLNPFYITSAVRLCKAFVRAAIRSSIIGDVPEEFKEEHSVYDRRPKDQIIGTLVDFASYSCMGEDVTRTLVTIMERTPDVVLENIHIISHLRNLSRHWEGSSYNPKSIPSGMLKRPDFVDIHVLRGER